MLNARETSRDAPSHYHGQPTARDGNPKAPIGSLTIQVNNLKNAPSVKHGHTGHAVAPCHPIHHRQVHRQVHQLAHRTGAGLDTNTWSRGDFTTHLRYPATQTWRYTLGINFVLSVNYCEREFPPHHCILSTKHVHLTLGLSLFFFTQINNW